MKKDKKGEKTIYIITVIIAIVLLGLLLIFVNIQHKGKDTNKVDKTSTVPTTTREIIKDKLRIDEKTIDIEVEKFTTSWGVDIKYEPLYFKVGSDDKILKFTSIIDKNTYLVIEKLTEDEYRKDSDIKGTDEDGEYVSIHRGIKNGQAYFKVTKHHKPGVEYDNIDIRMEYIIKQIS